MRADEARRLVDNFPNDLYYESLDDILNKIRDKAICGEYSISWEFLDSNLAHYIIVELRIREYNVIVTQKSTKLEGDIIQADVSWEPIAEGF